ncbi:MAG: gliding motility protein GldN [Cytophagaceae bacterium]|nr:gliding motility protein GldN [Cytophagaceae bacterium]
METPVEIQVQAPATQPAPLVQQQQPVPMEDTQVNSQEQTASNTRRAEQGDGGINPNSHLGIAESDIMYRVTNWRRMDLREKLNQPFFSKNNEITRYLIDGVRSGLLKVYTNDSLTTELSSESFSKNLMYENTEGGLSEEEKAAGFGKASADDGWGGDTKKAAPAKKGTGTTAATEDDGWGGSTAKKTNPKNATAPKQNDGFGDEPTASAGGAPIEYFPQELTILEIKEDFIFDRKRSRAYNDIHALTIIIPAEKTSRGFDVPVASFRYKDLDKYFRSNPTKFIWYNSLNQAQHKNMADAFDLRLFQARLIKQSNANDAFLTDIYGGEKQGLVKSQQLEYKLMEFEHNLWEY